MQTASRLARNQALSRSLNNRVATISQNTETFGALTFMCECGIYICMARVRLTIEEYDAIRLEPNQLLVCPEHILHAIEFVVADRGRYALVENVGAAGKQALVTDARAASNEPLARDTDAPLASL